MSALPHIVWLLAGSNRRRDQDGCQAIDYDYIDEFRRRGFPISTLECRRSRADEGMRDEILALHPDIIFTINARGLPALGRGMGERGIAIVNWSTENPLRPNFSALVEETAGWKRYLHLCIDRELAQVVRDMGVERSAYMPMATNPDRFAPLGHAVMYDVLFTGNSLTAEIEGYRTEMVRGLDARAAEEIAKAADGLQRRIYDTYSWKVGEMAREQLAGTSFLNADGFHNYCMFSELSAMRRSRLDMVATLADVARVLVIGDEGWRDHLRTEQYHPSLSIYSERFRDLMAESFIHLQHTRCSLPTGITDRVFNTLAMGKLCISNYTADCAELFRPDEELVTFSSYEEMKEKVSYFLEHREEAAGIAAQGRLRVLAEHTVSKRTDQIVGMLDSL